MGFFELHQSQLQHTKNIGYCKFGAKCRYKHFSELCPKKVCMDSECRFRHQKLCKFAGKCKFFQKNICAFMHDKELEKLEKEVQALDQSRKLNLLWTTHLPKTFCRVLRPRFILLTVDLPTITHSPLQD